ncbi:hypothetical protein NHF46_07830 [Arthrobacter alpinus]|nr:hypothetical protein [Arthrobacter alpinus]
MTGFGDQGEEASGITAAAPLSGRFGAQVSHSDIRELRGPLLVVGGADGVGWDEFATIDMDSGESRHGLVLEVDRDLATLQVLEGTDGMALGGIGIRFDGRPLHIQVGTAWLGRVCNGRGTARRRTAGDGDGDTSGQRLAVEPRLPGAPAEPVLTGVSVIDGLMTLVRGKNCRSFRCLACHT